MDNYSFTSLLKDAGVGIEEFGDIFKSVKKQRIIALAWEAGEEVVEGIIGRAKDQLVRHSDCRGTGFVLDGEGNATDTPCFDCQDTPGWVVRHADSEAVDRWAEIVELKKGVGDNIFDNRKQQMNIGVFGVQQLGGAPDITSIIKKADEMVYVPSSKQLTSAAGIEDLDVDLEPTRGGVGGVEEGEVVNQ